MSAAVIRTSEGIVVQSIALDGRGPMPSLRKRKMIGGIALAGFGPSTPERASFET
jgi:hypothetical protein